MSLFTCIFYVLSPCTVYFKLSNFILFSLENDDMESSKRCVKLLSLICNYNSLWYSIVLCPAQNNQPCCLCISPPEIHSRTITLPYVITSLTYGGLLTGRSRKAQHFVFGCLRKVYGWIAYQRLYESPYSTTKDANDDITVTENCILRKAGASHDDHKSSARGMIT